MYLVIFEDGEIKKVGKITDDDINASNDGFLTIIDIGNSKPKIHLAEGWEDISHLEIFND